MINSLSLLVAILVSLQCTFEASAQDRNGLDNNLQPNVVSTPKRGRPGNVVHIREAPPATVQLVPGTRLVLTCEVLGRPSPSVQWLKNGEPIIDDYEEETNAILPVHPSSATMLVSKLVVTAATSGDEFTCVATSGVKRDSASTTVFNVEDDEENLLTLQKLFRMPSKPVITTSYSSVFQDFGTDLVLPCRINSATKSQIYWQDNKGDIVYGNSKIRVLPSGDLLITNLRFSDMGNYTCIAKNAYGKDEASTFVYPVKVK